MNKKIDIVFNDCKAILENVPLKRFKNSRVMILGANAFLTSYIQSVIFYANQNNKLNCCIDSFSKSSPSDLIKYFIKKDKRIKFFKKDLTKIGNLKKIFKKRYDFIFLAATYGFPEKWLKDQIGTIFLNTYLLQQIFERYKKTNTRFLYFSSVDVYGDTNLHRKNKPVQENYPGSLNLNSKRITYGESKRIGEVICKNYIKSYKMKIYISRSAHTYGPGLKSSDKRVIIDFIKKAKNKNLKMLDKGKAVKTFGYISDITEMFFNIIQSGKENLYNTTGKDYISIYSLAKKINNFFPKSKVTFSKKITKLTHINSDPEKNLFSSNKYIKEFRKKKFVNLDKGLQNLIKWLN